MLPSNNTNPLPPFSPPRRLFLPLLLQLCCQLVVGSYIMCGRCGRVNVSDARFCDWCGCKVIVYVCVCVCVCCVCCACVCVCVMRRKKTYPYLLPPPQPKGSHLSVACPACGEHVHWHCSYCTSCGAFIRAPHRSHTNTHTYTHKHTHTYTHTHYRL